MKILESQSAVLTNYEVLTHLLELDAEYSGADGEGRARKKPDNLKIIMKDPYPDPTIGVAGCLTRPQTLTYLRRPNAPLTDPYNASALTSSSSLFARLAPKYRITKAEYVMLFNLRPKNLAELEVIIEEASTRFGEEELMEILETVADVLGYAGGGSGQAGAGAGVEAEEMEGVEKTVERQR
ncbi:HRDC-like protein [Cenococcum geophilum]